jgi:hypothetical protein
VAIEATCRDGVVKVVAPLRAKKESSVTKIAP